VEAASLIAKYFPNTGKEFCIGDCRIRTIVEQFGTPLFAYDRRILERKISLLRSTYPPRFEIFYSVKANPNQSFLRFFVERGCGLEIASSGEFFQAGSAGCAPERIFFAGPGKTEAELLEVLSRGIGEIHAESLLEITRAAAIARRLDIKAPLALRVNPGSAAEGGAMRMGGRPAPFGIDEESLSPALDAVLHDPNIEFRGIHLFAGTQILDYRLLLNQYQKGLEIARSAAHYVGAPLPTLDFGGGLGVPYFPHEQELDLAALQAELEDFVEQTSGDPLLSATRFVIEPGRYLVGEAGVYVTRITDIKVSRGRKFLIVDGGMNHHLAASGNLGQTIKRNYPVALLNRYSSPPEETVDVVGPLCTPLDVLARSVILPKAEVGDLLGILQSGAYARSASPLGFLSHATPPEVMVEGSDTWLIRQRGSPADYLLDQPQAQEQQVSQRSGSVS